MCSLEKINHTVGIKKNNECDKLLCDGESQLILKRKISCCEMWKNILASP